MSYPSFEGIYTEYPPLDDSEIDSIDSEDADQTDGQAI